MDTEYDFSGGKRGAIDHLSADETRITIRLVDTLMAKTTEILSSMRPVRIDTLQCLPQSWDSP